MITAITGVLVSSPTGAQPARERIAIARGENGYVTIAVVDSDGLPVNLSGRTVKLGVRRSDGSTSPLFGPRNAEIEDAANGICIVYFTAGDTASLRTGTYRFDVWVVDEDGEHQIVRASTFSVLETATRQGEGADAADPIPPVTNGAVDDLDDLQLVEASRLTDGFKLWVRDEDAYFQVVIGKGLAEGPDVVPALNLADGQWRRFVVAPPEEEEEEPVGDGVKEGADLTGGNQTITPGAASPKVSRQRLRTAIASGVTVTINVTGMELLDLFEIVREPGTGAGTLTVTQTGPGAGTWTIPGNNTNAIALMFYFNNAGDLVGVGRQQREPS